MRPPGWIVIEKPYKGTMTADGKAVTYNVRIRKWHPGFWWAAFRVLVLRRDP